MKESSNTHHFSPIKKIDAEKQIIYSEVYAPYSIDTYGDMMLPEDIEKAMKSFIAKQDMHRRVDTNHNNVPNGDYPIENFIAKKDDPDFTEGAWVMGVKVTDKKRWHQIKMGDINGYSMEAIVKFVPAVVEVLIEPSSVGRTEKTDDHSHYIFIERDEEGRVKCGRTSVDQGHAHEIYMGTATEQAYGHSHRFFM